MMEKKIDLLSFYATQEVTGIFHMILSVKLIASFQIEDPVLQVLT